MLLEELFDHLRLVDGLWRGVDEPEYLDDVRDLIERPACAAHLNASMVSAQARAAALAACTSSLRRAVWVNELSAASGRGPRRTGDQPAGTAVA